MLGQKPLLLLSTMLGGTLLFSACATTVQTSEPPSLQASGTRALRAAEPAVREAMARALRVEGYDIAFDDEGVLMTTPRRESATAGAGARTRRLDVRIIPDHKGGVRVIVSPRVEEDGVDVTQRVLSEPEQQQVEQSRLRNLLNRVESMVEDVDTTS